MAKFGRPIEALRSTWQMATSRLGRRNRAAVVPQAYQTPLEPEQSVGYAPSTLGMGLDIFSSDKAVKAQGIARFQDHLPEISSIGSTANALLRIHELITPDVTYADLPEEARSDMRSGLLLFDRPDTHRYTQAYREIVSSPDMKDLFMTGNMKGFYAQVQAQLTERMEPLTTITGEPQLKGALRSYGSRQVEGYPEEEHVFAAHTMVMATEMGLAFSSMDSRIIFPDAYYGLSVGLDQVYQKLCDRYDSMPVNTTDRQSVFAREAFFQLLGTRVLHPFWDANGRTFAAQLVTSLQKQGYSDATTDRAMQASEELAPIADKMVETVLRNAQLSLVTDRDQPLHLSVRFNVAMRNSYMTLLRQEIEHAIETADQPDSPYNKLIQQGAEILSQVA